MKLFSNLIHKKRPLLYILLGIIIGVGGCIGFIFAKQSIEKPKNQNTVGISSLFSNKTISEIPNNFDKIPEDKDGDCLITPNGKKYHNLQGCSYLRKSKQIRTVSSTKAKEQGLSPCSKCLIYE